MSKRVRICKDIEIPDKVAIERYRRVPDLGPEILFFSGGTALRDLSHRIIDYTHNSIHLITPFDSGGSSARIREAFNMISVGDLRNRLMALADQSIRGNPDIYQLFSYRLPHEDNSLLLKRIYEMIQGEDPLVAVIPQPMQQIICNYLRAFINKVPLDFNLSGANIGNLILTGGYLKNGRDIDTIIYIFKKLVEARGTVRPTVNQFLHLAAVLEDGTTILGQHKITGKEESPIVSPIRELYLTNSLDHPNVVNVETEDEIRTVIEGADLICYPMGSFYTSVVANLLPRGVGESIRGNDCPKVYIPNSTKDPEQQGMSLSDSVKAILDVLKEDQEEPDPRDLVSFVLVDLEKGKYPMEMDTDAVEKMGVPVLDVPLISPESSPLIDSGLLIHVLLSIA